MRGESKVQHSQILKPYQLSTNKVLMPKGAMTVLIKDTAVTGRIICLKVDKCLALDDLLEAAL